MASFNGFSFENPNTPTGLLNLCFCNAGKYFYDDNSVEFLNFVKQSLKSILKELRRMGDQPRLIVVILLMIRVFMSNLFKFNFLSFKHI